MHNNIYISSSCFGKIELEDLIRSCVKNGFYNLELGSNIPFCEDPEPILLKYLDDPMRYLVHNYFPTPKKSFVLNLASLESDILKKSINLCKTAIDLCAQIKSPFYSVHAGYAFNAAPGDLGHVLVDLPRIPYKKAYEIFLGSIKELCSYASDAGVKLTVENNVIASFNLINGKNEIALLTDSQEIMRFYDDVNSNNLWFLIDLGHLKVNTNTLGIEQDRFIEDVISNTIAFHLSENNGLVDEHSPFEKESMILDVKERHSNKYFIIETKYVDITELNKMINLLGGSFVN